MWLVPGARIPESGTATRLRQDRSMTAGPGGRVRHRRCAPERHVCAPPTAGRWAVRHLGDALKGPTAFALDENPSPDQGERRYDQQRQRNHAAVVAKDWSEKP